MPYLKIDPMKIDVGAVTQVISHAYAQRYRILPVAVSPMQVVIATCEPFDTRWLTDLGHILRRDIQRVVCNPVDLNRYLVEFYGVQRSIQKARDAKTDTNDGRAILNFEQLLELGKAGDVGADDRHVVHIVDWLLQYAFEQRASDIHLEPRRDTSPIRFRIDGVMHKVFELPTPVMTAVTARVKILGRMDLAEKRRPQDGRIKTRSTGGREVELRLSTMPTAFGEKVVMRIFDPDIVVKEFRQLGFSTDEEADLAQHGRASARHRARHRPDGFGQDHHAVFDAQAPGHARHQRVHGRRPDRNGVARIQPDAGAAGDRSRFRRRRAHADAPGSGHHHGRRNPRPGNRADGDPGFADRALGAVDPAYERCAERDCRACSISVRRIT